MKPKNNLKVRTAMVSNGLFQYEVAELLGVSEPKLCVMLRKELPEEEQDRIVKLIEDGKS